MIFTDADDSFSEMVSYNGLYLDFRTAITIVGNGGHTRLPASSRASRFFGYVMKPVSLNPKCPESCGGGIKVGIRGNFQCYSKSTKKKVAVKKQTITFISYRKTFRGFNYPTHQWCHLSPSGSTINIIDI